MNGLPQGQCSGTTEAYFRSPQKAHKSFGKVYFYSPESWRKWKFSRAKRTNLLTQYIHRHTKYRSRIKDGGKAKGRRNDRSIKGMCPFPSEELIVRPELSLL